MAENNSSATLLPCPFCGATAAVQNESPAGGGYFVDCKSCRASTNLRYACGDEPVPLLVAQWNTRAPLKTAEGAYPALPEPDAWRYTDARGHYRYRGKRAGFASEYQILKPEPLYTDEQMRAYAAQAVAAQAAPAALEVKDDYRAWYNEAMEASNEAGFVGLSAADTIRALAATPTLPATEDSSAGDLAEVQAEPVSSDPVAWHSKLYGTCWMHKQPYHLDAGTHFFVRGNPNPVATVLSGAAIQWHTGTAALEHGTFFYTAPQAQPADALDAARLMFLMDETDGFVIVEKDKYDFAIECAVEAGREEPTAADELNGVRRLLDAAMAAAQEGGNAAKEA